MQYQKISPVQHVLKRPEMYIGPTFPSTSETWMRADDGRLVYRPLTRTDGFIRLFSEVLCNAIDNVDRNGIKMRFIAASCDPTTGEIAVANDGYVVPVRVSTPAENNNSDNRSLYLPELVFGHLHTSSNFSVSTASGSFGLGVKLVNIFSRQFVVEINDPVHKRAYRQTWLNSMETVSAPEIKAYKKLRGFTRITYRVHEGLVGDIAVGDNLKILTRMLYQTAALVNVKVSFNGTPLTPTRLDDYVLQSIRSADPTYMYTASCSRTTRLLVTVGQGVTTSFVNGIETPCHGVHVDSVLKPFLRHAATILTAKLGFLVLPKDVAKHVNAWIVASGIQAPVFDSQTKQRLVGPPAQPAKLSVASIKTAFLTTDWSTSVVAAITAEKTPNIVGRALVSAPRPGSSRSFKPIDGYDRANHAGTKHRAATRLVLCEGLSAKTYAVAGIETGRVVDGTTCSRDTIGILALRGKILNVRNSTPAAIKANREVSALINILNLQQNVDYTASIKTLTYGGIIILCDSDADGQHITGLLLNFFDVLFPTLLARTPAYISSMLTPTVSALDRATRKRVHLWTDVADLGAYSHIRFLKGLGSSTPEDIRMSFGKRVVKWTPSAPGAMTLDHVFAAHSTAARREWMETYNPEAVVANPPTSIGDFIAGSLVRFAIENCARALPNVYDGLKESQRKILYTVLNAGSEATSKVAQLAGLVSQRTMYHHGEQCLAETIVKMAQSFTGSNNLPLLNEEGQFGCLAYNTPVAVWRPAYNLVPPETPPSQYCYAQDVKAGDLLVGDDNTVRCVRRSVSGFACLYTIYHPVHNISYRVTGNHVLVLMLAKHSDVVLTANHSITRRWFDVLSGTFKTAKDAIMMVHNTPFEITVEALYQLAARDIKTWFVTVGDIVDNVHLSRNTVPETYYGFSLHGNNRRFKIVGGIVTHNSRIAGGKDAASPRYISTAARPYLRSIFRREDESVLVHTVTDGKQTEPETYFPIIPLVLVNGSVAIATGWSTNIPSYSLVDVVEACRAWIVGGEQQPLVPHVRGFKGTIAAAPGGGFVTTGVVAIDKATRRAVITELPVGRWTETYKRFLESLDGITDLVDQSTTHNVRFEFTLLDEEVDLKLTSRISTNNLVLVTDSNTTPRKYADVAEILDTFCRKRLAKYEERLEMVQKQNAAKSRRVAAKLFFIKSVLAGAFDIRHSRQFCLDAPEIGEDDCENLVSIPVKQLTDKTVAALEDELVQLRKPLASARETWLAELGELLHETENLSNR